MRHGDLSNFFLWSWVFHDECLEEYGNSNTDFEGWAILGVGGFGAWFLIRNLRKRFGGQPGYVQLVRPEGRFQQEASDGIFDTRTRRP